MKMKNSNKYFSIFYILLISYSFSKDSLSYIVFNSKHYRAGHIAINSKGDMVVEYSNNSDRLFFGLKKNGKCFFKDINEKEVCIKEIKITDNNIYKRYESKNTFISLKNNSNVEYLFSTGAEETITELFNLDTGEHKVIKTVDYFGYELYTYLFPFLFLESTKEYLIIYISKTETHKLCFNKFSFIDFSLNQKSKTKKNYEFDLDNRTISCFIIKGKIIVFYLDNDDQYKIRIYNEELNLEINKNIFIGSGKYEQYGYSAFSKGYPLENEFMFFIYYTSKKIMLLNYQLEKLKIIMNLKHIYIMLLRAIILNGSNY